MINVQVDGYPFSIKFSHYVEGGRRCTTARILRGEELMGTGRAECSKGDNFSKLIGRYLAYSNALAYSGLRGSCSKELSRAFFSRNSPVKIKELALINGLKLGTL